MYLAFKKARYDGWMGWLINQLTIPAIGYSHVELLFSDGAWWSSRPGAGTSFVWLGRADLHEWCRMKLKVDSRQEERIREWCFNHCHRKYDWFGVIRFILPFLPIKLSKRRLFCSEACIKALQDNNVLDRDRCPALFINPNVLSLIVAADKGLVVNSFGMIREREEANV